MLTTPLMASEPNTQEARSASDSPPLLPVARMMASGPLAANRKADQRVGDVHEGEVAPEAAGATRERRLGCGSGPAEAGRSMTMGSVRSQAQWRAAGRAASIACAGRRRAQAQSRRCIDGNAGRLREATCRQMRCAGGAIADAGPQATSEAEQ